MSAISPSSRHLKITTNKPLQGLPAERSTDQIRAAFSVAFNVGLGRMIALVFSASAL